MAVAMLLVVSACAGEPVAMSEQGGSDAAAPVTAGQAEVTTAARAAGAPRAATPKFPYTPQAEWIPTQTNYWTGRRGGAVNYIVIHYTEISYQRTLRAFYSRASSVSAHYVVRGDGHIAQIVGEADTAWHAGHVWFNLNSIGIEVELNEFTNPRFTTEQYHATAALACAISGRHGVPLNRAFVVGHNEIPGTDHTDPGPTWNWPHFMWLTSLCAPPTVAHVAADFVSQTPYPEIDANGTGVVSIVLRNTGTTAWRKGTPQEARLGVPENRTELAHLAEGWIAPARPAAQAEEIVPPGGTATFTFAVKGTLPGTYVLPLRGVIDGAAWMNELGLFTVVTVR